MESAIEKVDGVLVFLFSKAASRDPGYALHNLNALSSSLACRGSYGNIGEEDGARQTAIKISSRHISLRISFD